MTHATEDELSRYAFDPESVPNRPAVERHLEACTDCRRTLEFVRSIDDGLRDDITWAFSDDLTSPSTTRLVLRDFAQQIAREDADADRLVGPLLAIYGQTYQTGADPYGLFLTWCALIIPWAVLGNFAAIWVLALLLLDVSLVLFYAQVLTPTNTADSLLLPLLIAALHAVAICAWEWQIRRDKPLMDEDWALRLIAVSGFVALFIPAAVLVFQDTKSGIAGLIGAVGLWGAVAGTMYYYRRVRPDRFMVVLAATAAMAWITVVVARLIFDILDLETFGMILMAAFVIWEITFGLKWYRRTRAS